MTSIADDSRPTGEIPMKRSLLGRIGAQNLSLLIALAVLLVIFGSIRPDVFFTPRNLVNIGLGITILGLLADEIAALDKAIVGGKP